MHGAREHVIKRRGSVVEVPRSVDRWPASGPAQAQKCAHGKSGLATQRHRSPANLSHLVPARALCTSNCDLWATPSGQKGAPALKAWHLWHLFKDGVGEGSGDRIKLVYIGGRPLSPFCFSTLKRQCVFNTCHRALRELYKYRQHCLQNMVNACIICRLVIGMHTCFTNIFFSL